MLPSQRGLANQVDLEEDVSPLDQSTFLIPFIQVTVSVFVLFAPVSIVCLRL